MRWNPCGAVVDFGRYPFTETVRPFRDSDTEVELVWYPAGDSVPALPYPSALFVQSWDRDQVDRLGVPLTTQHTPPFNHEPVKPLAFGLHQCGTRRDFAEGGHYDPNPPFVEYRPDGLPICCGLDFEGRGGLALGGVATVVYTPPIVGEGGLALDGTADVWYGDSIEGFGGLALDGTADVTYTPPGPTPGVDCDSAAEVEVGTEYAYELTSTDDVHWFKVDLADATEYHVETTGLDDGFAVLSLFYGGVCPLPIPLAFTEAGPPCWSWTTTSAATLRLRFDYVSDEPVMYTFKVATGPC